MAPQQLCGVGVCRVAEMAISRVRHAGLAGQECVHVVWCHPTEVVRCHNMMSAVCNRSRQDFEGQNGQDGTP
jgi:hypothetical protein